MFYLDADNLIYKREGDLRSYLYLLFLFKKKDFELAYNINLYLKITKTFL